MQRRKKKKKRKAGSSPRSNLCVRQRKRGERVREREGERTNRQILSMLSLTCPKTMTK